MKNKVEDLRNHLFATLEALQDKENPMELERAKTIAEVAQTIINAAKVEVDHMKVTDAITGGEFFEGRPALPGTPGAPRLVKGSSS